MKLNLQNRNVLYKVMKITFIQITLAMILSGMCYAKVSYAQKVLNEKISISIQNQSLDAALKQIASAANIKFIYSKSIVETSQIVSVSATDDKLVNVLNKLLVGNGIQFKLINNLFVLSKMKPVDSQDAVKDAQVVQGVNNAQPAQIKGKVVTESGVPVIGASVLIKGTNQGISTDVDGNFTINAAPGAILVIRYIGYKPKEVAVTNETTLKIVLEADANSLNEVIVTALGIKKEKKALGYSATELKGSEFTEARSVNIANSLEGKVAGLNLTTTATGANGSTRITLRGNGSISGNNEPLIVVDGVPINNDNGLLGSTVSISNGTYAGSDRGDGISSINPDEIESVTVLKGATAAALYGSRASNGAILFTTKSAKAGKGFGVEFNENATIEDLLYKHFDDYQYEYGSGTGGVEPTTVAQAKTGRFSWGGKLDGTPAMFYDGVMRPYVAQKDNLANFYNTGTSLSSGVALTGSTDNTKYRFSYTRLDYKGVLPTNTLDRDNFALNLNSNLGKRLSFVLNTKYSNEKNHNRPRVNDSPGNAAFSLDALPTSLGVDVLKAHKYDSNGYELAWSDNTFTTNPYYAEEDFKQDDNKRRIIASLEPKFQITDWLYLKGRFGMDHFNYDNTVIEPYGTAYEIRGLYQVNKRDFTETNSELMLGFNKTVAQDFAINALVAGNLMKQVTKAEDFGATNAFNIPFFYDISNTDPATRSLSQAYVEKRINSVYGSAEISYKNYLYLTGTGRNDWFSTLSPDRNSLFYPSVGLSFVVSDAFKMPDFVDYLKLRTSWAQSGGDTDPYNLSLYYQLNGAHLNSPTAVISNSQVPNPNLQPLTSTTTEAGVETRLFNNKLGLDVTVYNRKTKNDIVGATISETSGFNKALFNVGQISNKGIEVLLSITPVKTGGFSWDVSYNLGYNKSRVVALYGSLKTLVVDQGRYGSAFIQQTIGLPYSEIVGFDYKRDAQGNIVYDAGGLPMQGTLKNFGSGVSPYQMGLTNSFTYKKFSFSFLIDGKFGGYLYSGSDAFAYRFGLAKETLQGRDGGIVGVGVNQAGQPNTVRASAQDYWGNLFNKVAAINVFSSDFIKLRQVIFNYSLPTALLSKTPVKEASIGLVGRNLYTFMKRVPNIDPESTYNSSNAQGLEYAGAPATRTIGLNLNVKF